MQARTLAIAACAAFVLCALAAPATAQIISTSVPKSISGGGEGRWAFHVMGSPFAKWKYGEVYIGALDESILLSLGNVQATPNSDFLFAGEVAFKAGENWTVGVGGWYNKVGQTVYTFDGDNLDLDGNVFGLVADLDGDLSLYEGHVGLFYKAVGLQAGIVRTTGRIGTTVTARTFRFDGDEVPCTPAPECRFSVPTDKGDTTDWDLFAVYKHSGGGSYPLSVSLGAGVYGKQGVTDSPLRSDESATVFSGFATVNIGVYKGLGIDTSFWYIDKTSAIGSGDTRLGTRGTDNQYRFTIGLGYTFSN
jgi:hypothetical protein